MANNGWSKWKTAAAALIPRNWQKSSSHLSQVSGKRGGTGLGLTISSRLASDGRRTERHQHAGGWKLFCFTLAVTCCHCTRAKKTVNQAVRLDGLRLLLIEDNPLTQRITVEMLNISGAQVAVVGIRCRL